VRYNIDIRNREAKEMKKEMMQLIKQSKQEAATLVRFANPHTQHHTKYLPTAARITEILLRHIPYGTEKPVITGFRVSEFHSNALIKTARFIVTLANGDTYEITAYQHMKGRTAEEKEADKKVTFPSGLFNVFHTKIA
jgi:hypothetical protein